MTATGHISSNNEDKTRQKIIQLCAGTPYASMRGLWASSLVFSLIDVPTVHIQQPIKDMGPWQEAMDWAYRNTKLAAGLHSLPLYVDPDSLKIVKAKSVAHLAFTVSSKKVLWFSNTNRTFSTVMPVEAIGFVSRDISNEDLLIGSSTALKFYTKQSFDFFDAVPQSAKDITNIMKFIGGYEGALAKQEALRERIKALVPEVRRIVAEFQREHAKIQENLDGRLRSAAGDFVTDHIQRKAWNDFSKALGSVGHKDWKIVIKGLSSRAFFIVDIYQRAKDAWYIIKAGSFLTEQFFVLTNELKPKAKKIKSFQDEITSIEAIDVKPQLDHLKKNGVNIQRLKKYYEEKLHAASK